MNVAFGFGIVMKSVWDSYFEYPELESMFDHIREPFGLEFECKHRLMLLKL